MRNPAVGFLLAANAGAVDGAPGILNCHGFHSRREHADFIQALPVCWTWRIRVLDSRDDQPVKTDRGQPRYPLTTGIQAVPDRNLNIGIAPAERTRRGCDNGRRGLSRNRCLHSCMRQRTSCNCQHRQSSQDSLHSVHVLPIEVIFGRKGPGLAPYRLPAGTACDLEEILTFPSRPPNRSS